MEQEEEAVGVGSHRPPEMRFMSMPPARRPGNVSPEHPTSPEGTTRPARRGGTRPSGTGVAFASMMPGTMTAASLERSTPRGSVQWNTKLTSSWDGSAENIGGGEAAPSRPTTTFESVGGVVSTAERWKKKMAERMVSHESPQGHSASGLKSFQTVTSSTRKSGMFASMSGAMGLGSIASKPDTAASSSTVKKPTLKGRLAEVRAANAFRHAADDFEEEPKTLAGVLKKNAAKIKTMTILSQTTAKVANIKVAGVQLEDVPFRIDGGGATLKERSASGMVQFYILKEQFAWLVRMMWALSFNMFVAFLSASCFLAFPDWETSVSQSALKHYFTKGGLRLGGARTLDTFWNVSSTPDINAWITGPLVDAAFPQNGTVGGGRQGVVGGGRFALMGPVTMRQLRIRADSCSVPADVWMRPGQTSDSLILSKSDLTTFNLFSRELSLGAYIFDCTKNLPAPLGEPGCGMIQEYSGHWFAAWPRGQVGTLIGCYSGGVSDATQAKSNFGPIDLGRVKSNTYNMSKWTWTAGSVNGMATGVRGRWGHWYPGDGYVQQLGPTRAEAVEQTLDAVSGSWLDLSTRAVFVSVRAYHPSAQSLTHLTLSFEMPPGGGAIPWASAVSVHRSDVDASAAWGGALEVHILTLVLVFAFLVAEVFDMSEIGLAEYLEEPYHVQDIVSYLLYIAGFFVRISAFSTAPFPPPDPEPPTPPSTLDHPAVAMKVWRACLALNILMTYMRLIRTLPNVPMLRRIYLTINGILDLINASLVFLALSLVAYALAFHLGFGQAIHEFRSPASAFFMSLRMIRQGGLQDDMWDRLWDENRILGPLFFLTWSVLGSVITVGVFAAAGYAALRDVAQNMPVETMASYLGRIAAKVLLEQERRKEVIEKATKGHEMKKARAEGKGGHKDVLMEARQRMINQGSTIKISRPAGHTRGGGQDVDSRWTLFLRDLAGYRKEEVVEEKVFVTERKLREMEDKMFRICSAVSGLNEAIRTELGDEVIDAHSAAPSLSKLLEAKEGQKQSRSQGVSILSAPRDLLKPKERKKKQKLALNVSTHRTREQTGAKGVPKEKQVTSLNFRAVDAKGAAKLRQLLRHTH